MNKRVRLIDIAERLNLTKVSVSKALRDHPDISKETRELVKRTAEEMGYTPNLVARSLSSQRSNILGVVVPKIAHTFFASAIEAIQNEADRRGYGIILAVSMESAELERQHIERLLEMRVDGLLVSVSKEPPHLATYHRVRNMNTPLVFFDRKIDDLGFSSVTVDDEAGAVQAVEFLLSSGITRIAHIAGTHEVAIGRDRRKGFEGAILKHGVEIRPDWIIEGGFDEWHGYEAFARIIRSGDIPDAVVAVTFPVGLGIRAAIRDHAPELVDEVKIVAFGEGGFNEFYTYRHVCIRQPTEKIGVRAVDLLVDEINSSQPQKEVHIIMPTEVVTPEDRRASSLRRAESQT